MQGHGNSARRPASPGCGPSRGGALRLAIFAPIYGWFTEGFDTPDLIETKALLDTLA